MAIVNYEDAEGRPICPTCGHPIKETDAVARPDGCMVHIRCYAKALGQLDPCTPTP